MTDQSPGGAGGDGERRGSETNQSATNRRNRNRQTTINSERFEGKCEKIKSHVYDVSHVPDSYELFNSTTEAIGEYVATEYEYAGDYRRGLPDLAMPTIVAPHNPDPADVVAVELWKMDLKEHREQTRRRQALDQRVFGVILGQCSRTVRDRIEAATSWNTVNASSDPMGLLSLIRQSLFTGATTRKNVHALIDAEMALYKFKQGERMSNSKFLEKLKGLVEVYEHFGGEPGTNSQRVNEELQDTAANPSNPTVVERASAVSHARDAYMATLLLLKSDNKRYGALIADLENEHTRGVDAYPTSLSTAYDMLVNYKTTATNRFHSQDGGMSFYTDGDRDTDEHDGRSGRGGRTGRGRGRGRGGRGRGRENHNDRTVPPAAEAHVAAEAPYATGNEVAPVLPYMPEYTLTTHDRNALPRQWLLLDSCSSTDLISNEELLTDLQPSEEPLNVRCNAGTITLWNRGTLGSYPEKVWHNKNGVANIISMHNASKHFRLKMDAILHA